MTLEVKMSLNVHPINRHFSETLAQDYPAQDVHIPAELAMLSAGVYLPVSEALTFDLPLQPAEAYLLGATPIPQSGRSISGAKPNPDRVGLTERSLPHPDDYGSSDNGEYYGSIKPYRRLQVERFHLPLRTSS